MTETVTQTQAHRLDWHIRGEFLQSLSAMAESLIGRELAS